MRARRRMMASPAQRLAWVTERTHKKAVREAEQSQRAARWNEPNTVALDDIEVPPSFAENEITKLWYMSHCGPDGQFEAPHLQFSGFSQQPPPPPLKRRLVLLGRLAPLVLPKYAAMLWQIAGWRIVLQVAADALIGLIPAWGTFAQGKLVDAVQRSLYRGDVPAQEIIRLALYSILSSNARPLITVILANNAQRCSDLVTRKTDRIHLQLNLDIDMAASSNPVVATLLKDCASFGFQGGTQVSGLPHLRSLVDSLATFTNIFASLILCFTTLKAFSDFGMTSPLSTVFFIALATFPTFLPDLVRQLGLIAPNEDYYLWQESANKAHTFYSIATSFAYKQEVLLFGLRDWIIDSWAKYKEESDKYRSPDQDLLGKSLAVTSVPENIIKDVLYLGLGLRFFSEKITLGTLHIIQSTVGSVYWNISSVQSRVEDIIHTTNGIAAFIGAQDWVREQAAGHGRSHQYEPNIPKEGEKRGMRIEARNLSFRYPTGKVQALRNINLTIEPGETLAIVGFNGGGKTTLAKVLTGLYDYEGSLLIDGVEARAYQRESLHRYMTMCPQNFAVFPLSIRENIGIGQVDEMDNDAAIMEAVRRGGAEEVIRIHGLDQNLAQAGAAPNMAWDQPEQPEQPPQPAQPGQPDQPDQPEQPEQPKRKEIEPGNKDNKSEIIDEKARIKSLPTAQTELVQGADEKQRPMGEKLTNGGDAAPLLPRKSKDTSKKAHLRMPPPSVSLSGGQMQRVAISRAFMRADQATLVVLDEPSASLDARAEYELFQRIYALSKGAADETRTTIYISHRFSTVRRADKIAVVEDGGIIELGSHKELMELNGRYAEFFTLQVKAFSE